jgi:hypothetical protein
VSSVFPINKGINRPVEFKGLKAQYIWWLGGGLIAVLVVFAILYIFGLNAFVCLGIAVLLGTLLFMKVYGMSRKYGEHGLMKKLSRRYIPTCIKVRSRNVFLQLSK